MAFDRMTQQELAIIQGPPGTGKTFTSVGALQSLVQTFGKTDPPVPIIVAAETNHALDQLLSACMQSFQANIVRFGGRSEDEDVSNRSLFKLRRASKAARTNMRIKNQRETQKEEITKCISLCFPVNGLISAEAFLDENVITADQYASLVDMMEDNVPEGTNPVDLWLEHKIETDITVNFVAPKEHSEESQLQREANKLKHQRFNSDDENNDEKNKLEGRFISTEPYKAKASGRQTSLMRTLTLNRASSELKKHSDLYNIRPHSRELVYQYLRHRLISKVTCKFQHLVRIYQATCNEMAISRWKNNIEVIRKEGVQIIGCTTTGLTKYRGLIAALEPKVLLVEEAAEALEAKITSALYPTLDQLILVGDHQQLVPQVSVQEIGLEPYNFNVSLFERLVYAGLPFSMLTTQRRMIPAIREVVQTFYPDIVDHQSVKDPEERPPVPGMNGINHWWFDHSFPDYRTPTMSRSNLDEARMIVSFAKYLVGNGIMPSQITVLSYYKAQLDMVENELVRVFPDRGACCSVRTVDGFQGEQNEIILLSLVRSCNASERVSPGFVENENRAVVALSRAKRGLFVFGCQRILHNSIASEETWAKVLKVFASQGRIGQSIPLTCDTHRKVTHIQHPDDWDHTALDGGCEEQCEGKCASGHPCSLKCHPTEWSACKCSWPCEKKLPCGHACSSCCGEPCKCQAKSCGTRKVRGERGPASSNGSQTSSQDSNSNVHTTAAAAENWSTEQVQRKDRARVQSQPTQSSSKPPKIKFVHTYIPTKINDRGDRVVKTITPPSEVKMLIDLSEDAVEVSKPFNGVQMSGPLLVGEVGEQGATSMPIADDLLA